MTALSLDLAFGFHDPDHWIGRYTRFRATLPRGCHRLTGQFYCPTLPDGSHRGVLFALHDRPLADLAGLGDMGWRPFDIPLPAVSNATIIDIMLRTSSFSRPLSPDKRLLGVMLKDFAVQVED